MPLTYTATPFSSHSLDVTSLLQPKPRGITFIIAQVFLPAFHQASLVSPIARACTPCPNKMQPPCDQFALSGQGLVLSLCAVQGEKGEVITCDRALGTIISRR